MQNIFNFILKNVFKKPLFLYPNKYDFIVFHYEVDSFHKIINHQMWILM